MYSPTSSPSPCDWGKEASLPHQRVSGTFAPGTLQTAPAFIFQEQCHCLWRSYTVFLLDTWCCWPMRVLPFLLGEMRRGPYIFLSTFR